MIRCACAIAVLASTLVTIPADAQWSDDPFFNAPIATGSAEQVQPKVVRTPDGGGYVSWFQNNGGMYNVRMQRFNAAGVAQWGTDGLLISNHPSNSSTVDYDLAVDEENHAILVFADARNGSDLDIYAYRIAPNGFFIWGPDGLTLSNNADFEPAPTVCIAEGGDVIVAWARIPDSGTGSIRVQRITPFGKLLYQDGGLAINGGTNEKPAFCDVIPSSLDSCIVMWIRDIGTFQSPRHIRAQRVNSNGTLAWNGGQPVEIYNALSLPIAYLPIVLTDEAGGAVFGWHVFTGGGYRSYVQRVNANGQKQFGANGTEIAVTPNLYHINPWITFDKDSQSVFATWNRETTSQSQWGVHAQRIAANGARQWGDEGIAIVPMDAVYKSSPRIVQESGVARILWGESVENPAFTSKLRAAAIDLDGEDVWAPAITDVATSPGTKFRLQFTVDDDGMTVAVWEDERNGGSDIFMQNINADGSLGLTEGVPMMVETTEVIFGSLVSGGVEQIRESDDDRLVTRSNFGFSAIEPNLMVLETVFSNTISPTAIDLELESRINHPVGAVTVRLKKVQGGAFQTVGTYSIGMTETTETIIGLSAFDYLTPAGEVTMQVKHVVQAVFSVLGFDSSFDRLAVMQH